MDGGQAVEMEGIWWEKDEGGERRGTERGREREKGWVRDDKRRENPSVGKGLAAVICGEPR